MSTIEMQEAVNNSNRTELETRRVAGRLAWMFANHAHTIGVTGLCVLDGIFNPERAEAEACVYGNEIEDTIRFFEAMGIITFYEARQLVARAEWMSRLQFRVRQIGSFGGRRFTHPLTRAQYVFLTRLCTNGFRPNWYKMVDDILRNPENA